MCVPILKEKFKEELDFFVDLIWNDPNTIYHDAVIKPDIKYTGIIGWNHTKWYSAKKEYRHKVFDT